MVSAASPRWSSSAGLEGDVFSLNPLFTYKFEGENRMAR